MVVTERKMDGGVELVGELLGHELGDVLGGFGLHSAFVSKSMEAIKTKLGKLSPLFYRHI